MHELKPARLDEAVEARAYRNKFPWKWVTVGVLVVGAVVGGYQWKKYRDTSALRTRILNVHERELGPRRARVLTLERRIEGFVADALQRVPTDTADGRVDVNQLRHGQGLYLRISAGSITGPSQVGEAARSMQADAIMNCMGLSPVSARTLYEKGQFLEPAWTNAVRDASDVLRLRVLEEELAHRVRTDLPVAEHAARSDWFMLAIERGASRTSGPVDFYIWNLRDSANLLSVRTTANGGFITVRANLNGDAVGTPSPAVERAAVAADCSIASQVLAQTGNPTATATNTSPTVQAASPSTAPTAAASATTSAAPAAAFAPAHE